MSLDCNDWEEKSEELPDKVTSEHVGKVCPVAH
jgi:hypothetical protein